MKSLSNNLAGCGCLLLTLAILGFFLGAAGSNRAITVLFDITADRLGSSGYAAIALGAAGIALILISFSIDLLTETDEDLSQDE